MKNVDATLDQQPSVDLVRGALPPGGECQLWRLVETQLHQRDSPVWDEMSEEFLQSLPWGVLLRIRPLIPERVAHLSSALDLTLLHLGKTAAIARDFTATPHALGQVARCPDPGIRMDVARNPRTSAATLKRLSADEHPEVVALVAAHPACPPQVLKELCDHPAAWRNAVQHPRLPVLMKRSLAYSASPDVAVHLAANPNLPWGSIRALLARKDHDVTVAVSGHHLDRVLVRGALEEKEHVCRVVSPRHWGERPVPLESSVRLALTENNSPDGNPLQWAHGVRDLVDDPDPRVRAGAVQWCEWGTARALVSDPVWFVRVATLRHPHADADSVHLLSLDPHGSVRRAAALAVLRTLR